MLKKLAAVIILLLTMTSPQAAELGGRVSWIFDGDTLQVEGIGRVRLIGIDTPEYEASSRDRFYTKNFAIAPEKLRKAAEQAKDYNIRQVKDRRVRLVFDRERKDKHGRLLAYVFLPDGEMLNRLLLEKGLATVFRRYEFRLKNDFLQAEKTARGNRLGLWEP